MTTPGLDLADFQTMFPEFSAVSTSLIDTFINLINNGYNFTTNDVTDTTILNIYYQLLAHFVSTSTQPVTGNIAGPSGSYMPDSTTASHVSISFMQIQNLSLDQSFMNSTRYGQVFWMMTKQQYVQNFYLNQWFF